MILNHQERVQNKDSEQSQKNKTNLFNVVFKIWATDFQNGMQDNQII